MKLSYEQLYVQNKKHKKSGWRRVIWELCLTLFSKDGQTMFPVLLFFHTMADQRYYPAVDSSPPPLDLDRVVLTSPKRLRRRGVVRCVRPDQKILGNSCLVLLD